MLLLLRCSVGLIRSLLEVKKVIILRVRVGVQDLSPRYHLRSTFFFHQHYYLPTSIIIDVVLLIFDYSVGLAEHPEWLVGLID